MVISNYSLIYTKSGCPSYKLKNDICPNNEEKITAFCFCDKYVIYLSNSCRFLSTRFQKRVIHNDYIKEYIVGCDTV